MLTFRNRLLILLIGLVIGAQTVTFVTALARTSASETQRANAQLASGAQIARKLIDYRERQLANAVAVLAADYGLKEAVGSGDKATLASALGNHAARVDAQLTVAFDLDGAVIATGEGTRPIDAALAKALIEQGEHSSSAPRFVVSGNDVYQVFMAPVRAPDEIARVALGFIVNDALAKEMHDLVGVDVAFMTDTTRGALASVGATPTVVKLATGDYLAIRTRLSTAQPNVDIALFKPMTEVRAPYRQLALNLSLIFGVTLAAAVVAGIYLGRSAARPVQRMAEGALRVAAGDYSTHVEAAGGQELANLAEAFNGMQTGIAQREARLLHLARHDDATGLPNRRHAEEWLAARLQSAGVHEAAIIMLGVTNLQEMSAGLGSGIADEMIRHLTAQLARWQGENGLVARMDTARFVVLVDGTSPNALPALARSVRASALLPLQTAGVSLQAAVVVGVARAPTDSSNAVEVLRCAEAAIEAAIEAHLPIGFFERADDEAQRRRLKIGVDLPDALARDALHLVYQPKLRLSDRRCGSVEALVRWQHPEFGNIPPSEFVAIAERTGASAALTRWVLGSALQQLAKWHAAGLHMEVAVNLSATDLVDPDLLEHILESLRKVHVPADSLMLEITESAFIHDGATASRNMELLRVAGVRFSVDDFGTGYSSLSQLRQLAVDELKIDQSFVRGLATNAEDAAIIRAVIDLGHGMGLRIVAEGVEDAAQLRRLVDLGCDYAQGYLISRPQPAAELEPLLRSAGVVTGETQQTASLRVLELRRLKS
ncbi:MAG: EAL domain-containing protein [Pseudomonadota bacterium]